MPPGVAWLEALAVVEPGARQLIDKHWPGPLTLVLPAQQFGSIVMQGGDTVGARIPDDDVARELAPVRFSASYDQRESIRLAQREDRPRSVCVL